VIINVTLGTVQLSEGLEGLVNLLLEAEHKAREGQYIMALAGQGTYLKCLNLRQQTMLKALGVNLSSVADLLGTLREEVVVR
jgi:hypothetical protein